MKVVKRSQPSWQQYLRLISEQGYDVVLSAQIIAGNILDIGLVCKDGQTALRIAESPKLRMFEGAAGVLDFPGFNGHVALKSHRQHGRTREVTKEEVIARIILAIEEL